MTVSDWIEWKGGEQPVSDDALVEVRFRDGGDWTDSGVRWDWWHDDTPVSFDIVAYRVVSA